MFYVDSQFCHHDTLPYQTPSFFFSVIDSTLLQPLHWTGVISPESWSVIWTMATRTMASQSYSLPHASHLHPTGAPHTHSNKTKKKPWQSRLPFSTSTSHNDSEERLSRSNSHASHALTTSSKRRQKKWWKIRLFRGMVNDVRRRAPYYWSDWRDAWDYRVVPATVYMYFAKYGPRHVAIDCHIFYTTEIVALCTRYRDSNAFDSTGDA